VAGRFIFADEAGNFDFSRNQGASRYFVLTTVTMADCRTGDALATFRRELIWRGFNLHEAFHANDDGPVVRNEVYSLLMRWPFRVDATVLEKSKAQPHLQSDLALYKMGWYLHFKYIAPLVVTSQDRLSVIAASLGTKRTRGLFTTAVDDVVRQVSPARYRVASWKSDSDVCLQIADYCCWAIQRSWERGDSGPLGLIQTKIASNTDIWAMGTTHYY
jgi:Protein of unknown function (DUF3800)